MKSAIFLRNSLLFKTFHRLLYLQANSLRLNNLETKKVLKAKLSGFAIYVKAIK